jgi:hypothetical protein
VNTLDNNFETKMFFIKVYMEEYVMKKIIVLILTLSLVFGMIGCTSGDENSGTVAQDSDSEQFDENFQKMVEWEKEYKIEHPDATDEEISQAFNEAMDGLDKWVKDYKAKNPDATDEEVNQAFEDAWK